METGTDVASKPTNSSIDPEVLGEVQIVLAEKRTALAVLRTGIAVFALPVSVLSFLVVTSKYYEPGRVLHFLLPLLVLSAALAILALTWSYIR